MKTEIAFLLDRSDSMDSILDATIAGFNAFLHDQQAAPGPTRLTLVLFDDVIEIPIDSLPVAEVTELSEQTFLPRGSTALLDAVGLTIDRLGARLAALPAAERPDLVVIAILTDGEENCSWRYTWQDIATRITHQTQHYQWEFLFLGAGPDAIATAARMQIPFANSARYIADSAGQTAASSSLSRKISASRAAKSPAATHQQLCEAARPIAEILHEESHRGSNSEPRSRTT